MSRGPESSRRLVAWLVVSSLGTLACSGGKEPESLPSQTVTQVTPQLAAPPPAPPRIRETQPTRPSVKVIEAGGEGDQPKTLLEASQLAKARKGVETRQPIAVINDENLHEYAESADVIILESPPAAPEPQLDDAPVEERSQLRDEQYWRSRALELRMGWRRAIDRIGELELESAALRQQFYAEEDPYLRDSQLKPAWDRVLDRLDQLRDQAAGYEQQLDVLVSDGQRADVPQGWLNQGWELEPTPEERKSLGDDAPQAADGRTGDHAIDPPVVEQDEDPGEVVP